MGLSPPELEEQSPHPTSPTSTFTGVAGTAYTLRWTISNPPCQPLRMMSYHLQPEPDGIPMPVLIRQEQRCAVLLQQRLQPILLQ